MNLRYEVWQGGQRIGEPFAHERRAQLAARQIAKPKGYLYKWTPVKDVPAAVEVIKVDYNRRWIVFRAKWSNEAARVLGVELYKEIKQ